MPEASLLSLLTSDHRHEREAALAEFLARPRSAKQDGVIETWQNAAEDGRARLAALWLAEALGRRKPHLLDRVLGDQDGKVRAAGVRVLGDWIGVLGEKEAFTRLSKAAADPAFSAF